jgi:hypothetical protein
MNVFDDLALLTNPFGADPSPSFAKDVSICVRLKY